MLFLVICLLFECIVTKTDLQRSIPVDLNVLPNTTMNPGKSLCGGGEFDSSTNLLHSRHLLITLFMACFPFGIQNSNLIYASVSLTQL